MTTRSIPFARRPLLAVLMASGLIAGAACGPSRPALPVAGSIDADKFLFDRGTEALAKKNWLVAREYFRRLVDTYPQSSYRADAKIGLGDSYLGENSIESAILGANEFREFLNFFPRNARTDYAQFKIGQAHYRQMLSAQRDQTATRETIVEFEKFMAGYPDSPLRPEAARLLRSARDRLSESEFEVGYLYLRMRWPPGAIDRFKALLKDDPEFTRRDRVYYYLGDSLEKVSHAAEALPYYEKIVEEFPKSEFVENARKRISALKR